MKVVEALLLRFAFPVAVAILRNWKCDPRHDILVVLLGNSQSADTFVMEMFNTSFAMVMPVSRLNTSPPAAMDAARLSALIKPVKNRATSAAQRISTV